MNESELLYEVMRELGKHGAVFRTNAGQFYTKGGHLVSGLPKGFSDIMLVLPGGQACFIETKVGSNKAMPEQEQFLKRMQLLGARAGLAYSVHDACVICGVDAPPDTS